VRGMIRRLRLDRNPLRRTVDRVETIVMAVLLAVFLAGVPLAALSAAGRVAAVGKSVERAEAGWRLVPAVLLQNAPGSAQPLDQASLMPLVRARWTAPDGTPRVGEIYAPDGAKARTTVMVWTDQSGKLEGAPFKGSYLVAQEIYAAFVAAALGTVAVAVIALLARRALDQRRLAAWEAEWSRIGSEWTGHP
jgi:hypothetical protein